MAKKESCTDKILEWLKKPETKSHIRAAGQKLDRKTVKKLVKGIRNRGKNLARTQDIGITKAMEQAQAIELEGLKEQMNTARITARLSAIKLARQRLIAAGNDWDAKKLESAWFSGVMHKGVGVREGMNAGINTYYTRLSNGNGGIWNRLQKINAIALLKDRGTTARIVDQILKQQFSDDMIGKAARIIDEHNALSLKLMRQVGIPIRGLLGRVSKQFHNPVRMLNPKGLNKRLATKLGVTQPELLMKKISSLGSKEYERLKVDTAFEMWRDYIKPKLDWNLSFLDVDHEDDNAINEALRNTFDSIIHKVTAGKIEAPYEIGEDYVPAEEISRKSALATRIARPERRYFFKNGTAWVDYSEDYGAGGLKASIDRDMRSTARSIGVVSKFGPNAEHVYKKLRAEVIEKNKGVPSSDKYIARMDRQMDLVTGKLYGGTASKISQYMQNLESFNNLTKLGHVVFHSLSDVSNQWGSMSYAGMTFPEKIASQFENVQRMFRTGSDEEQDFRDCLGVGTKHVIGTVNRFGVDPNSFRGLLSRADATMFKWNGLQWWDEGLKRGTMATYSRYLARNSSKQFHQLNPKLRRLLTLYNWKPEEWEVWRKHGIKIVDKKTYLTPDSFMEASDDEIKGTELNREELYQKAMMFLEDQYRYVVPQASLLDQANRALRMQTPAGAAINLMMQYKSYGINFVRNILMRNFQGSDNNYEVAAALTQTIVGSMILGYAGEVATGWLTNKSAPPLTGEHAAYTWSHSILSALGVIGDGISAATSSKENIVSELGPSFSLADESRTYLTSMAKHVFESPSHRDRKSAALLSYEFAKRNFPFLNTPIGSMVMSYGIGKEIMNALQPGSYSAMVQRSRSYTGETPIHQ